MVWISGQDFGGPKFLKKFLSLSPAKKIGQLFKYCDMSPPPGLSETCVVGSEIIC